WPTPNRAGSRATRPCSAWRAGVRKRSIDPIALALRVIKICRHRRTCADGDDTAREMCHKIVCEEPRDECAVLGNILSKRTPKGETDPSGNCRAGLLPPLRHQTLVLAC